MSFKTVNTNGDSMEYRFQEYYKTLYAKLVRQAAFLIGDPTAAEDLVQEAFFKLHRSNPASIQHPAAWLAKVTNNLCFNYLRSEGARRRREENLSQQFPGTGITWVPPAEEVVLDREEVRLVKYALEKLPSRDRMVLLMKFSGYSYDEIAAVTELKKSSVGTILVRARARFKHEYELLINYRGVT